jgi:hypothetical protein
LIPRYTTDAQDYLSHVGLFLRRQPVEHSVLLSVPATHFSAPVTCFSDAGASAEPNLWLWVEDGSDVVAAAQHTPPHGAYVSSGPTEAMQTLARTLWQLRPGLPGVAGLDPAPHEFAAEWSRLGGPQSIIAMRLGLYAADEVIIPLGISGRLRPATDGDASLLRLWADHFIAETGATSGEKDEVGPRIDAGLLFVWEVYDSVVSMASVTAAQAGVSRVNFVYTPPGKRKHGYASACVAALTARELATPGRTCMLNTDLANPTSNAIYQAVGYRRVGDAAILRFDTP